MSDMELRELIKKQSSYKSRLTAFSNYLSELSGSINSQQVNELQLRIGNIKILYEQFDNVQLTLECIDDDINLQTLERNKFESLYYKCLSQAQDFVVYNQKVTKLESLDDKQEAQENEKLIELPVIEIQKFNGAYENWLEFRDAFSSLIHLNENIENVNKFVYLKTALQGSAALIIQSIEISATNYSVAWQLVCDRYDNKNVLIQNHVSVLFKLNFLKTECANSLRSLIDRFKKNLHSLDKLGEPTQQWDTLLIRIITRKLHAKTFREWEKIKNSFDKNQQITLQDLLGFIQNRIELLESTESSLGNKGKTPSIKKHADVASLEPTSINNEHSTSSITACPNCNGDHELLNCGQFLNLSNEQRLEIIPKFKVCFNCFRFNHYANRCKKGGCKICKRKHNVLIHVAAVKMVPSQKSSANQTLTTYKV